MNPIRLMAKLTPKTINLEGSSGGSKTIDSIDWTTAAHALVGLSKDANNWALYRFAGHDEKLKSVYRSLSMNIVLFIKINRYKLQPETLDGLIKAAVLEYIQPVCGVCNGAGYTNELNNQGECIQCKGRGRKLFSKRFMCEVIGINHKSYSNSHDEVSKELIRIVGTWEQQIMSNIHSKMGEVA
ncbi:hypothetical protein [uncultured Psychrosphaera sp.]|uniref:hypothetical protein n=1 Tax=uncultured Psychrosphaera sp. TaxID=1403522 RepID=UPI0026166798|nr:hypothetical protein [uncultured Psychrosphaera sp.]